MIADQKRRSFFRGLFKGDHLGTRDLAFSPHVLVRIARISKPFQQVLSITEHSDQEDTALPSCCCLAVCRIEEELTLQGLGMER